MPNQGRKNRDGLFIDAVVLVENSGYGRRDDKGHEQPLTCLITRVYPDTEPATGKEGDERAWTGDRPFIDAVGVRDVGDKLEGLGEVLILKKVPYFRDVQREARIIGVPVQAITWPGYRVVTVLEGIR